jgi:hypothetical protein
MAQIPKIPELTINPLQKSGQNQPNGTRTVNRGPLLAALFLGLREMRAIGVGGVLISVGRTDVLIVRDVSGFLI